MREFTYKFVRFLINCIPGFHPGRNRISLVVFPIVDNYSEFLDIYHKARFYITSDKISEINILVDERLRSNLVSQENNPFPDYIEASDERGIVPNVMFHSGTVPAWKVFLEADYVLIWDWKIVESGRWWVRLFQSKLLNIDRHKHIWEGWTWAKIEFDLYGKQEREEIFAQSQIDFNLYLDKFPRYSKVYLFGTGPSLDRAMEFNYSDGYRIVCNTIVRNSELLNHIQPHIVVAADAIYHFGNNRFSYQFRKDLENALLAFDIRLITADIFLPILIHYHSEIARKTIFARTDRQKIFLDMRKDFGYSDLSNIMNGLLLPIGTSLADNIYLLGFDGRNPGDQQFWTNSEANSYAELKSTIMSSHPGFFANMDYPGYAADQSRDAELIMSRGEKLGKKYYTLAPSAIPALKNRVVAS